MEFCQHFHHADARITIVDRANHHLFQPLLYQVATAGLSGPDIAQPIRSIFSKRQDITVLMDEAVDFDFVNKRVVLKHIQLPYDFLVLAMGGRNCYFGKPQWSQFAPGLKNLQDAMAIRSELLMAFERAENGADDARRKKLLTMVIVGGGPTGVEMAGAFAELARKVLRRDFRRIDPGQARIVLLEGGPAILAQFPKKLSDSARRQLESMHVEVRTSTRVKEILKEKVELETGEVIEAATIVWAAGIAAVETTQKLGAPLDKAGRVKVNSDLSLPGQPAVFAIGDMATMAGDDGKPIPGVAPAAMQMGRHVAKIIGAELNGGGKDRPPFKYHDKGTMATIGRSAAVAWRGKIMVSGFLAWLMWLVVHLLYLTGIRNQLAVLFQWTYSYLTYKRGARIIAPESASQGRDAPPRRPG